MSAVLDVKHKKPAVDHLVVRLSVNEARDLLAAYKAAHDTNHHFFNVWGRLPELVNQITEAIGNQPDRNRSVQQHPDGGYGALSDSFIGMTFTTKMPEVDSNVRTQP